MDSTQTTRGSTTHIGAASKGGHPRYQAANDAFPDENTALSAGDPPDASALPPYAFIPHAIVGLGAPHMKQVSAAKSVLPTATAASSTALYLLEAGDSSAISVNDINQGQIGDCFLLASIGEIALWHSSSITNMIYANQDGTETVTLHLSASGQLPTYGTTLFKTTTVTINNSFPTNAVNNGASQDVVNGVKEIWVQVLEKAVATLCGGYNAIANGGNPMIAMEELAGQSATSVSPGSLTLQMLQSYMAAGDLIVMDTPATGTLPFNLVNSHAYMFESEAVVNGTPMIQLGNPWGFNQPQAIPLSQLSSGIVEVDIGTFIDSNLITGGSGNDTIALTAPVTNASIDLGAGNDTLTLANGTNSATVANTETIIGGTGDDTITLSAAGNNASIDLGAGSDVLTFGNLANTATVANTETITGGSGVDTITLGSALSTAMQVDLGGGANKLTLASVANAGTISNVGTLIGGSGADVVAMATPLVYGKVDLGPGNDSLTLANATNTATISNVETLTGGSGTDTIILGGASVGGSIDLGAGSDSLTFGNFTNTATVGNAETIIGGTGNDNVMLGNALNNAMRIDLSSGSNTLSLANGSNTGTISNVGTLLGGTGTDMITLGSSTQNASIDLGTGADTLTFGNFTNSATVANVETITGGTGNDAVTLSGPLTNAVVVDLGAGGNKLTLASGGNTGTVKNVGTIIGGTGNDTVVLGGAMVNGSVDLGGGSDTISLSNFTNRVSIANTETVYGGSGNDTIILTGSAASMVVGGAGMNFITGNSGADQFVLDRNSYGNLTMLMNFGAAKGDMIALDTTGSNTFSNNVYDLGGTGLIVNKDLADVANLAGRLATALSNGGKGGFVYQQNTGELFYSANGSFAGGGTQIGIITTDGAKPWTFNASSFVQV